MPRAPLFVCFLGRDGVSGVGGLSRLKDSDAIEIFCDCVLGFGGKTRTQLVETVVCVLVQEEKTRTQLVETGVCVLVQEEKTRTQMVETGVCVLVQEEKTRTQLVETGVCVLVGVTGVDVWAERLGQNGVFCAILTQLAGTKLGQVMCFPRI